MANCCIDTVTVYSRTASGNTAPLRTLSGGATGLGSPFGLGLALTNNELIVANTGDESSVTVCAVPTAPGGGTSELGRYVNFPRAPGVAATPDATPHPVHAG